MKKLYFIALLLNTFIATAQKRQIDSVYYLIDTVNTRINDRMWDIYEEYPSFKLYVIKCPCLLYDQEPTFAYDVTLNKGITIDKTAFDRIKFINLPTLILKAKASANTGVNVAFFLVEPIDKKYIYHKVRLLKPLKPRPPLIDYESIPGPDTTKHKKP